MTKTQATQESWVGTTFANNWEILEKYSCAEYRNIYQEVTGDTTKQIKNVHYKVKNKDCGIETYMERTTIGRAINDERTVMSKCKGCVNGSKLTENTCYYAEQCRIKNLGKIPNRTPKIQIGEIYGLFKVLSIRPSENYPDHQCRADVQCIDCGKIQTECRFDNILEGTLSCKCFRKRSHGEKIIYHYLKAHPSIIWDNEYTFDDLVGKKGGSLRYDFVIFDNNDNVIQLVEFDGLQHFKSCDRFGGEEEFRIRQEHDKMKDEYAAKHNISLIRIPYTEILNINNILDKELIS